MIFKLFKKIFFNNKSRDKSTEQLIKELKVRAAELAVFKEAESKRLKFRLAKIWMFNLKVVTFYLSSFKPLIMIQ